MTSFEELPDMARLEQVADFLQIGRTLVYEEAARYETSKGVDGLPNIRVGRTRRVPKWRLRAWIDGQLGSESPDASDAA